MAKQNLTSALQSCSELASCIMDKIDALFKKEAIDFSHKNHSEIIVTGKSKKEISELITSLDGVDKSQMKMILQLSESNGNLFIRQKFN